MLMWQPDRHRRANIRWVKLIETSDPEEAHGSLDFNFKQFEAFNQPLRVTCAKGPRL